MCPGAETAGGVAGGADLPGTAANPGRSGGSDRPAELDGGLIAVSERDLQICTDNTVRLVEARNWALSQEED